MRTLCLCVAVAMAAGTIYLQAPAKPAVSVSWDWSDFFKHTESGWFDPSYNSNEIPERWQIGKHSYTTRDLMGRPI